VADTTLEIALAYEKFVKGSGEIIKALQALQKVAKATKGDVDKARTDTVKAAEGAAKAEVAAAKATEAAAKAKVAAIKKAAREEEQALRKIEREVVKELRTRRSLSEAAVKLARKTEADRTRAMREGQALRASLFKTAAAQKVARERAAAAAEIAALRDAEAESRRIFKSRAEQRKKDASEKKRLDREKIQSEKRVAQEAKKAASEKIKADRASAKASKDTSKQVKRDVNTLLGAYRDIILASRRVGTQVTVAMKQVSSSVGKAVRGVRTDVTSLQAAIAIGAVTTVGTAAVSKAGDFETGLAKIGTILPPDTARDDLKQYRDALLKLNEESAKDLLDITEGAFRVIGGLPVAAREFGNVIDILTQAVRTAEAGGAGVDETVRAFLAVLNSYSEAGLTATQVSDKFFATINRGNTNIKELAGSVGNSAAAAAKFGITIDELLGGVATLTTGGQNARASFVALTGLMNAFIRPGTKAKEAFEKAAEASGHFGFEAKASTLKQLGLVGVLEVVNKGLSENVDGMAKAVRNIRGMRGAAGLTGAAFERFKDNVEAVNGAVGDTDNALTFFRGTLNRTTAILGAKFTTALVTIGEQIIPGVVAKFNELGEAIQANQNEIATAFKGLFDNLVALLDWTVRNREALLYFFGVIFFAPRIFAFAAVIGSVTLALVRLGKQALITASLMGSAGATGALNYIAGFKAGLSGIGGSIAASLLSAQGLILIAAGTVAAAIGAVITIAVVKGINNGFLSSQAADKANAIGRGVARETAERDKETQALIARKRFNKEGLPPELDSSTFLIPGKGPGAKPQAVGALDAAVALSKADFEKQVAEKAARQIAEQGRIGAEIVRIQQERPEAVADVEKRKGDVAGVVVGAAEQLAASEQRLETLDEQFKTALERSRAIGLAQEALEGKSKIAIEKAEAIKAQAEADAKRAASDKEFADALEAGKGKAEKNDAARKKASDAAEKARRKAAREALRDAKRLDRENERRLKAILDAEQAQREAELELRGIRNESAREALENAHALFNEQVENVENLTEAELLGLAEKVEGYANFLNERKELVAEELRLVQASADDAKKVEDEQLEERLRTLKADKAAPLELEEELQKALLDKTEQGIRKQAALSKALETGAQLREAATAAAEAKKDEIDAGVEAAKLRAFGEQEEFERQERLAVKPRARVTRKLEKGEFARGVERQTRANQEFADERFGSNVATAQTLIGGATSGVATLFGAGSGAATAAGAGASALAGSVVPYIAIAEAIKGLLGSLAEFITGGGLNVWFQEFFENLDNFLLAVVEDLPANFVNLMTETLPEWIEHFLSETIPRFISSLITDFIPGMVEGIFKGIPLMVAGFVKGIAGLFAGLGQAIVDGFAAAIAALGGGAGGKVAGLLTSPLSGLKSAGRILTGDAGGEDYFRALLPGALSVVDLFKNKGGPIRSSARGSSPLAAAFSAMGAQRFADGGTVRGLLAARLGADTEPALLAAGEGVVNREGMNRIGGEAGLDAINRGSSQANLQAPTGVNIRIGGALGALVNQVEASVIDPRGRVVQSFNRRKRVPMMSSVVRRT